MRTTRRFGLLGGFAITALCTALLFHAKFGLGQIIDAGTDLSASQAQGVEELAQNAEELQTEFAQFAELHAQDSPERWRDAARDWHGANAPALAVQASTRFLRQIVDR